jgi:hypothetical protein
MLVFRVRTAFDSEASVWYVVESNVPGLVTEAEAPEKLFQKVIEMIPDLLRLNHFEIDANLVEVPIEFIAKRTERVRLAAA